MAMSGRARDKRMERAQALLGGGTQVRAYGIGRGDTRVTPAAVVAGTALLVLFLGGLALGLVIIGGAIPIALALYVYGEVRPPRAVVVADTGLVVMATSFWSGHPSEVLVEVPLAPIVGAAPLGPVSLVFGDERLTLSRREFGVVETGIADALHHGLRAQPGVGGTD